MLKHYILSITLMMLTPSAIAAQKKIHVMTYYDSFPFITGEDTGLIYDFVDLLEKHAEHQYNFIVVQATKRRVNVSLTTEDNIIIPFVNPVWLDDEDKTKYLWSKFIVEGRNEIITRVESRFEYLDASSLYGNSFAGIKGHRYKAIEHALKIGKIKKNDYDSYHQCLRLVAAGKSFATTMPTNTFHFLAKELKLTSKLQISDQPFARYKRYLMLNKDMASEYPSIMLVLKKLKADPRWQTLLKKYLLTGPTNPGLQR